MNCALSRRLYLDKKCSNYFAFERLKILYTNKIRNNLLFHQTYWNDRYTFKKASSRKSPPANPHKKFALPKCCDAVKTCSKSRPLKWVKGSDGLATNETSHQLFLCFPVARKKDVSITSGGVIHHGGDTAGGSLA